MWCVSFPLNSRNTLKQVRPEGLLQQSPVQNVSFPLNSRNTLRPRWLLYPHQCRGQLPAVVSFPLNSRNTLRLGPEQNNNPKEGAFLVSFPLNSRNTLRPGLHIALSTAYSTNRIGLASHSLLVAGIPSDSFAIMLVVVLYAVVKSLIPS